MRWKVFLGAWGIFFAHSESLVLDFLCIKPGHRSNPATRFSWHWYTSFYWIRSIVTSSNRACQVVVIHVLKYKFECWYIKSSVNLAVLCESLRVRGQRRREEDASSVLGSLLKCTDQSDFPICLANEMMTYGGNMNSFDEASFLMQSSGLEGGAHVYLCACVDPVASWHGVISVALLILPKKRARVCVCVAAPKPASGPCVLLN